MKLSTTFVSGALIFSGVALALPSRTDGFAKRASDRLHRGRPLARIDKSQAASATNSSHTEFSGNWSGAVLTSPPAGQNFTSAVGTFTVPTMPPATSNGAAAAWVGIDGDTYRTAILQAGVDFIVNGNTSSYAAWWEWWPSPAVLFDDFDISAGDEITITIDATSNSEGTVYLDNLSTGSSVSQALTAPSNSSVLGGQNAEWIVEDYSQNGGLVPLANWGTVTFVNASASSGNQTVGLTGADVFDISQFNVILTNVTINDDSSVSISHT